MKNSNLNLNLVTIKRQLASAVSPIIKHRTLIVILIALLSIIITVYKMQNILTQTEDQPYYTEAKSKNAVKTHFDQDTISKIEKLEDPETSSGLPDLPEGRINPFTK